MPLTRKLQFFGDQWAIMCNIVIDTHQKNAVTKWVILLLLLNWFKWCLAHFKAISPFRLPNVVLLKISSYMVQTVSKPIHKNLISEASTGQILMITTHFEAPDLYCKSIYYLGQLKKIFLYQRKKYIWYFVISNWKEQKLFMFVSFKCLLLCYSRVLVVLVKI